MIRSNGVRILRVNMVTEIVHAFFLQSWTLRHTSHTLSSPCRTVIIIISSSSRSSSCIT